MGLEDAFGKWVGIVGRPHVLDGETASQEYGCSTTWVKRKLAGALRPFECSQVPLIVKVAAEHKIGLYPISTGHNWGYGTALPPIDNCIILDLSRLNRIIDFDVETGLLTVEPGVTQGQLAEFLDREGHPFMVPVTGAGPTCSILGNALERGYGITPHADHFGSVMSVQAVLSDGSFYQTALTGLGGEQLDRAFKWGVGPYLDGIFSQGSFGIVTQMTIALARRPESIRSFLFGIRHTEQLGELVVCVRKIIASYPGIIGGVNLMNAHRVLAMTVPYPHESVKKKGETISPDILYELSRRNQVMPWTGFGTLYGSNGVVKVVQQEIREILSPLAARLVFISPERARTFVRFGGLLPSYFRSRIGHKLKTLERSLQLVAGYPNQTALPLCYWLKTSEPEHGVMLDPARDGCGLIWYAPLVPMRTESIVRYVQMVYTIMDKYKLEPLMTLTSLSERCFDSTVPLLFDLNSRDACINAERCYWALLEEGKRQGFLPYRVDIQTMKWLSENASPYWQTVRRIKDALDPNAIISPGRYV